MFYQDAILCNRLADLYWNGDMKRLTVSFPERVLDKYVNAMVNKGFKVAVIE